MYKALFTFEGSFADLVLAMTAVEAFAYDYPGAKVDMLVADRYGPFVKDSWFVRKTFTVESQAGALSDYEFVHKLVVDREACGVAELEDRKARRQAADLVMQAKAEAAGIPIEDVEKPADYPMLKATAPMWHKIQGYCYTIQEALGDVDLDSLPAEPAILRAKGLRSIGNNYLHCHRDTITAGVPYIIVDRADSLVSIGLDSIPIPKGYTRVDVDSEELPTTVAALVENPRCRAVIGFPGAAGYLGWASGRVVTVDIIIEQDSPNWVATHGSRSFGFAGYDPQAIINANVTLSHVWQRYLGG